MALNTFELTRTLANKEETMALARRFWSLLTPSAVLLLEGDLGSGKTQWIQAMLGEAGVTDVKSPTFDLVHLYTIGDLTIYHADLYRIASEEELLVLDLPAPGEEHQIVLVEWGARLRPYYPSRFELTLTPLEAERRLVELRAYGESAVARLQAWEDEGDGL